MPYYKVLYRLKNGFRLSSGYIPDSLRQTYRIGKTTKSKFEGGKLFVFSNLDSAKDFIEAIKGYRPVEIWEVIVENPEPISRIPNVWTPYAIQKNEEILDNLKDFWRTKTLKSNYLTLQFSVRDCFAVDSITLKQKIS